ncbi:MAG: tail fiber protein [Acetobacteraceae bacterium]
MSEPYLGQIEIFGFGYPPRGWALCAGQLMSIAQNQALFSLLGTAFGGDGITTFALPDLRGRTPIGQGNGPGLTPREVGASIGEETHALTVDETPYHSHNIGVLYNPDVANNTNVPDNTVVLAQATGVDRNGNPLTMDIYVADSAPDQKLADTAITSTGGKAHPNLMPYLTLNVCIALQGSFPSRG